MSVLGVVGIADKGVYNASATYKKMNFVLYNGSSWLALKDNLTGVTPEEGENWKYLARGWAAELLSMISAIDTSGLLGTAGATVDGQALMDVIADKVATKLLLKTDVVSQQQNSTSKAASAALAYAMEQEIGTLTSNLTNVSNRLVTDGLQTWSYAELQANAEKTVNWNDYSLLIIGTGNYSNIWETITVPTSYFINSTSSSGKAILKAYDGSTIEVFKTSTTSIKVAAFSLVNEQKLWVFGVVHK